MTPSVVIAVPFERGAIVAATTQEPTVRLLPEDPARLHTGVVKTPWGLLAALVPTSALDRSRRALLHSRAVTVAEIQDDVAGLLPPDGPPVLISYEPEESAEGDPRLLRELADEGRSGGTWLGLPIRLYRLGGQEPTRLSWGALVAPPAMAPDLARDGELHLQWGLDRGTGYDSRLEAVMATFAWLREREPRLSPEVDLGIHDPGHHYSVDRARW
jgi:hypothetical protein